MVTPEARPRAARRWRRLLAILAVGTLAAGVGIAWLSQTAGFRDWVRRQVLARVNAGIAGRLAIGRLDGNLFGRLVATDVRLVLDDQRILALRRVVATYDLLAIVGGGLTIDTLDVTGATLVLASDARGWNVERLAPPTPDDDHPLAVRVERLHLTDGSVRIMTPERAWRMRGLTFVGAARVASDATQLAIEQLSFREQGSGLRLEGEGRITGSATAGWNVEGVRLRTAGSQLDVAGRIGSEVDLHLRVPRLAAVELRAVLGAAAPASDWRGEIDAAGPRDAVVVTGDLRAECTQDDTTRAAGHARFEGTLDFRPPTPRGALRAEIENVDLAAITGREVPPTDLTGRVDIARTDDVARSWTFAVDLRAPRIGTTSVPSLRATGDADEHAVHVSADVAATTGTARAVATLEPGAERFDLAVTTHDLDLGPVLERAELAGRLNGVLTVAGTGFTVATTDATASLTLSPSRIGGVAITGGSVAAHAKAGRLVIERASVVTDAASVEAAGDLGLAADVAARTGGLRGEARVRDVGPIATLAGRPDLGGAMTLKFTATGNPQALDVRVDLAGRGLRGSGWRAETVDAKLTAIRLGAADAQATLAGQARTVTVGERRLRDVALDGWWHGEAASARAGIDVRGHEADGQHVLAAELVRAGDTTRVTVTQLRLDYRGESWTAVGTPSVVQRGDRLEIENFTLRSDRGTVRVGGTLVRSGASDLLLTINGLDLAVLAGLVPDQMRGRLVGQAHLGGTLDAPRVDADLALHDPTLGEMRYQELRTHLVAGPERLEWQGRLVQEADRALVFAGAVPLRFALEPWRFEVAGGLTGRVRADAVDLGFLAALWPGLITRVAGTLTADLALGGTLTLPEMRGTVAVAGGRAYVVPLGLTYDPVDLAVDLEGRALSIERLAIRSGKGQLDGGGNARLGSDGTVIDARFEMKSFPLFGNQYGKGAASGWLWISGTTAAPVLEGSLETDGLVLQIPEVIPGGGHPPDPTIVVLGPGAPVPSPNVAAVAPPPPVPGIVDRTAVTVQLAVPRNAWIRRSDANVELQGWMTAWKKAGEPLQLAGDIRGVRGWYAFQGKKFNLAESSVRFSGQGLDPTLDITATHTAGDYLVRLKVGGTVTKPSLTLESEPALDQADVLAVLLFGAPANALSRSQATGLREQALGIAGGYLASELRQSVANALGVDDLQFDTGTQGLGDARVSVGKYVADDIFVSLAHKFGAQSVEEVRIEYVIRPGWSLETSTDTLGRSGIDLFWKRRY